MKNLILTIIAVLITSIGFTQVQTGVIYRSASEPASYIKFLEDGTVLYTDSKVQDIEIYEVLNGTGTSTDKVIIIKSKANRMKGTKVSFVIDNGKSKNNCIAVANGELLDVVMLGSDGKKQVTYKPVHL